MIMFPKMIYSTALGLSALLLYMIGGNEVDGGFLLIPEDPELCKNRPKHWKWINTNADGYYVDVNGNVNSDANPHHYFYSNDVKEYKGQKYDWLAARNLCRQYCMDAVSIESFNENQMLYSFMDSRGLLGGRSERITAEYNVTRNSVDGYCGPHHPALDTGYSHLVQCIQDSEYNCCKEQCPSINYYEGCECLEATYSYWAQCNPDSEYHCCNKHGQCTRNDFYEDCGCLDCIDFKEKVEFLWTSGRLCDFPGCESQYETESLLVKGWFWSGSNQNIHYTNEINAPEWNFIPWGKTGHFETPQPDNAENAVNGVPESCLAIAKDLYADGIQWHDISCYHPKPVICEDSDDLLKHIVL